MKRVHWRLYFLVVSLLVVYISSQGWAAQVSIAHMWGPTSHTHLGLERALEQFKQIRPDIEVEILPNVSADKVIVSQIGGVPADILFVDGQFVSSWALQGLIQPLTSYVARSDVSSQDYIPPAWRQVEWRDNVWAMPLIVDPNFGLLWNKDHFSMAGLDENVGPSTVAELEAMHQRLTRYDGGMMQQIGIVPWFLHGYPNTLFTWGWIFGGEFYDPETGQITAHHPQNVEALEWLQQFYDRHIADVEILQWGLPQRSGEQEYLSLFMGGRESMKPAVTGDLYTTLLNAPEIRLGVGQMPVHDGANVQNPTWIGGWTLAIANGSTQPETAWEVIRYLTADEVGTSLFASASGWFPAYLPSPVFQEHFAQDPMLRVYMDILVSASFQRPVIPVQQEYWNQLNTAVFSAYLGMMPAHDALLAVSQRVQAELELALQR